MISSICSQLLANLLTNLDGFVVVVERWRVVVLHLLTVHTDELQRWDVLGTRAGKPSTAGQLVSIEQFGWQLQDLREEQSQVLS